MHREKWQCKTLKSKKQNSIQHMYIKLHSSVLVILDKSSLLCTWWVRYGVLCSVGKRGRVGVSLISLFTGLPQDDGLPQLGPPCIVSGPTYCWQQMIGRWRCLDCWTSLSFWLRWSLNAARTSAVCFRFDRLSPWLGAVQSFLTDRMQQIAYSGQLSSVQSVLFGVLQGSALGPLLYVLYTAELALVVDRHGLSLYQYADDTQVYISTPAGDAEAAVRRLTACHRHTGAGWGHDGQRPGPAQNVQQRAQCGSLRNPK